MVLSFGFFILFLGFNSSASAVAKALKDSGFDKLGYYSISILYLGFGLGSIWAPKIVRRFNPKFTIVISTLTYALYSSSLCLTTIFLTSGLLNKT